MMNLNYKRWTRPLGLLCLSLMLAAGGALAQVQAVRGTVTDTSGGAVVGANVLEQGTANATITDASGRFELSVRPGVVLEVRFLGYRTQEVRAVSGSDMSIVLSEDAEVLDDVVVVAYGVQKKATLSGSVASVAGDEIVKAPVMNVSNSLAGRLPGVVVISEGSEPGYDGATVRIRGVNTFGNAAPLVVVDGVPGRSLERIDPNTIESMSVMKDASAAIYGAQAANGVILITTKRGSQGKPTIDFSINYGFSRPARIPQMTNAAEYGTLLNEIDIYAGRNARYTEDDIRKFADGSDLWAYPNTDWFAETLKPWSPQTTTNVSIGGGSETMNYYVGFSARNQDGIYKKGATSYDQHDLRANLDWKLGKYISLFTNISGRMETRNYPTRSAENIFRMLMRSKPNMPAYWPNGLPGPDIELGDNPVVIVTDKTGYERDRRYVLNGDFGVDVKIPWIDGLSVKGTASLDKNFRFRKRWQTPWYLYSWDGVSRGEDGQPTLVEGMKGFSDPRLTENMEDNYNMLLSGLLNYTKTFADDHIVNVLAGMERITGGGDSFEAYRRYFISTAIDQLFAGGQNEMNNNGSAFREARFNYFGRVNYAFRSKYLAEFVWLYQGSYIFDQANRFGFFPGVSLGWVASEEGFWEGIKPVVNFAKLRVSWGQTGNDRINPYQYLASYDFDNLMFISGGGSANNQALQEGVAPNINVTWETATQKNIGLDLEFLGGDLALTVDYFVNERNNILWRRNASVPASSGLSLPDENLGKVRNQGVDFNISYRKRWGDFNFAAGLNGVYARNKILFWDEAPGVPEYQRSTGRPIGASLYYETAGIFRDDAHVNSMPHWAGARPGDIIFVDHNKDGVIDGNDRVRTNKSRTPLFTGGLSLDLGWKNFDLSMLFQGALGGVFYQDSESGDFGNFLKSFYDKRWTEANLDAEYPRTFNRSNEYWINQRNTFWLRKTDYVRLKNIELGYTLPRDLTGRVFSRLRIYVSANNLLTYSPDMKDYDPENTSGRGYNHPLNKIVNMGLNVTF